MCSVNKAIVGCAGRGTRLLPASKAIPKVMMPVGPIPTIQHIVHSLVLGGIENVMLVISHGQECIVDYFSRDHSLELTLSHANKIQYLDDLRYLINKVSISFCYQHEQLGTADMFQQAEHRIGDQSFLALYGDEIPHPKTIKGIIDAFNKSSHSLVGALEADIEELSKCGVFSLNEAGFVEYVVEKPLSGQAPSNLTNRGPFLFGPEIFAYMKKTRTNAMRGERELTDTMNAFARDFLLKPYILHHGQWDIGTTENRVNTNREFAKFDYSLTKLL